MHNALVKVLVAGLIAAGTIYAGLSMSSAKPKAMGDMTGGGTGGMTGGGGIAR
jgi:hypothetical protein